MGALVPRVFPVLRGSVGELVAAGDDAALDRLGDWLAVGPSMARVDHVEVAPADSDDDLPQPFAVR